MMLYLTWLLVLVGFTRRRQLSFDARLLLLTLLIWYAFHIFVHASVRQRVPSDVLAALLALVVWFAPKSQTAAGAEPLPLPGD
jgi:hypothetical protein